MDKAVSIAITSKPCEVRQYPTFRVQRTSKSIRRNFTVCVKPLDFREDISYHLIQWIEIIRILGADRIDFYVQKLRENTTKVLKWLV